MTCESCGHQIEIGDWPFCPHGRGCCGVVSDSFRGGVTLENLGPEPVTVYSETERRRIMKERGLEDFVRHRPLPGTDKSALTTNWAAASRTTLDNATALVSRPSTSARDPEAQLETAQFTITEREDGFRVAPDGEPYIP